MAGVRTMQHADREADRRGEDETAFEPARDVSVVDPVQPTGADADYGTRSIWQRGPGALASFASQVMTTQPSASASAT